MDADAAFDPNDLWPVAEDDADELARLPLTTLYLGACGVLWALDALRRRGRAETRLDLAGAARRVLGAWREESDFPPAEPLPATATASLWMGETAVLLVAWRLTGDAALADDLHARVLETNACETNELMWGAPGGLLAARAMLDWTGEERWAAAWRVGADELWRRRDPDGLWTQRLYGHDRKFLGPAHGAVGNVVALLGGGELLDEGRREALRRDAAAALERAAVREGDLANWAPLAGAPLGDPIRVQWCHGAPGVVASAASYLDEDLLLAGAELTWRAGPLVKGPGLCHGTAGNGYALLAAFARTGDELWLERARRFAVHALEQVERLRDSRGRGRYTLWLGDIGVALYAADCLEGRAAVPTVDSWDDRRQGLPCGA